MNVDSSLFAVKWSIVVWSSFSVSMPSEFLLWKPTWSLFLCTSTAIVICWFFIRVSCLVSRIDYERISFRSYDTWFFLPLCVHAYFLLWPHNRVTSPPVYLSQPPRLLPILKLLISRYLLLVCFLSLSQNRLVSRFLALFAMRNLLSIFPLSFPLQGSNTSEESVPSRALSIMAFISCSIPLFICCCISCTHTAFSNQPFWGMNAV